MRSVVETHFSTNTPRAISQFSLSFLPFLKSCLIPFPPYLKLSLPPRHAVVSVYVTTFFLYIPPPYFPGARHFQVVTLSVPLPPSLLHSRTWRILSLCRVIGGFRLTGPGVTSSYVCVREREREYRCARSPARPLLALSGFCPVTSLRSLLLDCRLETTATTNGNLITKRTA